MSDPDFVELEAGEEVISVDPDSPELLWRQICDHHIDDGKLAMNAFGPEKSDERRPSFSRQSKVTAQESRDWHNDWATKKSRGVWACSVAEVASAGTRAVDDSATPVKPGELRAPGHAFVDYRHLTKNGLKTVKGFLLREALRRREVPTVDRQPREVEASRRV